ncbi:hypothetical protein [Desulfovibrio inopinatus]|uniref:hypothetical protein n=1 Tax=Desulfovibrio inopinatus TaxID=102109 RepID=UPI000481C6BA|nr:hypothetical protein [Desulfovibrio inopinatus]
MAFNSHWYILLFWLFACMIGFLPGYLYSLYRDSRLFPGDEMLWFNEKKIDYVLQKSFGFYCLLIVIGSFIAAITVFSLVFRDGDIVQVVLGYLSAILWPMVFVIGSLEYFNCDCVVIDEIIYVKVLKTKYIWISIPLLTVTHYGVPSERKWLSRYRGAIYVGKKMYGFGYMNNRAELFRYLDAHGIQRK